MLQGCCHAYDTTTLTGVRRYLRLPKLPVQGFHFLLTASPSPRGFAVRGGRGSHGLLVGILRSASRVQLFPVTHKARE